MTLPFLLHIIAMQPLAILGARESNRLYHSVHGGLFF